MSCILYFQLTAVYVMFHSAHALQLVHHRITEDIQNENQGILMWKSVSLFPRKLIRSLEAQGRMINFVNSSAKQKSNSSTNIIKSSIRVVIYFQKQVTLVKHKVFFLLLLFYPKGADEEPDYYLKLLSQSRPTHSAATRSVNFTTPL